MPRADENAAMRRYGSPLAVDRRQRAISLDASAACCVPRRTTAWPSQGNHANMGGGGWGCREYCGAGE